MPYLVFEYDPKRNVDDFVTALALTQLQPKKNFEAVKPFVRTRRITAKITLTQLVSLQVNRLHPRTKLILKTKLELKSDKHLVSAYGESYVGFISGSENKSKLLDRIQLDDVLNDFAYLKRQHGPHKTALHGLSGKLSFTDQEIEEFIAICENAVRPIHEWIDEHAAPTKAAIAKLPDFIQRDF